MTEPQGIDQSMAWDVFATYLPLFAEFERRGTDYFASSADSRFSPMVSRRTQTVFV